MKPLHFDQKTLSLQQWATTLDIPYSTLHRRYKQGLRPPELFRPPKYHKPASRDIAHTLVTLGTTTKTLRNWSNELQIPYATLKQRYIRGKRGIELLKTPRHYTTPNPDNAVLTINGQTQSLYKWALKFNISWIIAYKRYMAGARTPYALLHTEQNKDTLTAILNTSNSNQHT